MKYQWFWNQQEAVANPLLMFWNLQKAAVKTFARVPVEISMVLESAINVLESPDGCCEDICTFCNRKYEWFWNQQEAAANQVTLQFHCFIYKTAVIIDIMVAVVGVIDWFYL